MKSARPQMVAGNADMARKYYADQVFKRKWGGLIQDSIAGRV